MENDHRSHFALAHTRERIADLADFPLLARLKQSSGTSYTVRTCWGLALSFLLYDH